MEILKYVCRPRGLSRKLVLVHKGGMGSKYLKIPAHVLSDESYDKAETKN